MHKKSTITIEASLLDFNKVLSGEHMKNQRVEKFYKDWINKVLDSIEKEFSVTMNRDGLS